MWHEEIENHDENADSASKQRHAEATQADKRRFNELAAETNGTQQTPALN